MKHFYLMLAVLLAGCCQGDPEVRLYAEKDGCKLYVAQKRWCQAIFFTNCSGSAQWTVNHGKYTTTHNVTGGK